MVDFAGRLSNSSDEIEGLLAAKERSPGRRAAPLHRRNRSLSEEEAALLAKLYESGRTIQMLDDRFEVHRGTVQRHLSRHGVATRYRKLSVADVEECARRYRAGETTTQIAADMGVHKDTVRRRLGGIGTEMRSGRFGER